MKIYIIGTGIMGSAIAKILRGSGHKLYLYDHDGRKAKQLAKQVKGILDNRLGQLPEADVVLVAVKPQDVPALAGQIKIPAPATLISIAAGIKIAKLQKLFQHKKVIRIMPNLGLAVGQGIAGWKSAGLSAQEIAQMKKLLDQITENFEVGKESDIDSVTAISGSGPAYFFYLADVLQKAAEDLGFDSITARKLAEKTFSAAAILQTGQSYEDLIKRVASKKGTTEAALKVFQKRHFGQIVAAAAKAAQKRAKELSNG